MNDPRSDRRPGDPTSLRAPAPTTNPRGHWGLRAAFATTLWGVLACGPADGDTPNDPIAAPTLTVTDAGNFTISLDERALQVQEAAVWLAGGSERRLQDAASVEYARDESGSHRWRGLFDDVTLELSVEARDDHIRARLQATGAVRVEGFVLRGRAPANPRAVYQEGYSSWSPAYVVAPGRGDPGEEALTGVDGDHLFADPRISWWTGALAYEDAALVTGALTADTFKTRVLSFEDDDDGFAWRIVMGGGGDNLPAEGGIASEELFFTLAPTGIEALDRYGQQVAAVRPPLAAPFVPVGWNSWNTFFTDITPEDIVSTARFLKDTLPGLGLNNIQLDDGWQVAWGDWEENERFATGLTALAGELRGQGYHPGIWWAPFLADVESRTVAEHPAWLLRDELGEPVFYGSSTLGYRYYVLDTSHPEVRAFVLATLDRLLEAGFTYLKLDFLFGGSAEGVRFDPDTTGLRAFGSLMDEMTRRAEARRAYLLACGAPLLPSAGRFHAIRTGDDIAFADLAYSFAMNKNAFRNVASRFYVNHFLASDPDTVLVRALSEDSQRLNVTAALLSGQILNLGDAIVNLDTARLDVLRKIPELAVPGAYLQDPEGPRPRFVPLDLFETPNVAIDNKFAHILAPDDYVIPSLWYLRLDERQSLLAIFNWFSDDEWRQVALPPDAAGYTSARGLWTDTALSVENGRIGLEVPAEGVRLLLLQ